MLALAVGPFADHLLLGAHMRDQALDGLGEVGHRRRGAAAAAALFSHRAYPFHRMLQFAGDAGSAVAIFAYGGGEPVLEVGVEAVLRLARLQVEKAQDQGAGEAEQRGRERNAHAAKRRGQPVLQGVEQGAGIAADLQAVDHLADGTYGFDQAPEGAEQAEKDQQARHVAGNIARFVQPRRDRVQQMPHRLLGNRHSPRALAAEDSSHRRQQFRTAFDRQPGIGDAEIVDPGHLRIEPDHLPERQDDADQEHPPDQCVEAGVGKEGCDDLLVEHNHHQRAQHQEHQHPHQENSGRRQLAQFDLHFGAGGGA